MIVRGHPVNDEIGCIHYDSAIDFFSMEFNCCGQYIPCHRCHDETVDHPIERWLPDEFDRHAVLCGRCGAELTIQAYLDCQDQCPQCGAASIPVVKRIVILFEV